MRLIFNFTSISFFSIWSVAYQIALAETLQSDFSKIVDSYFEAYQKDNPTSATALGDHRYDDQIEDFSRTAIEKQIKRERETLTKLQKLNSRKFSSDEKTEYQFLTSAIQANLIGLEKSRYWERNPEQYVRAAGRMSFAIMSRNYADAATRLKSLISREERIPLIFKEAKKNLTNPPKIYTEVALEEIPDTIQFFKNDVPAAFVSVKDPALQISFQAANAKVMEAFIEYQKYLEKEVLPRSNGDYRIGAKRYSEKLRYEEMIEAPLPKLLSLAYQNLRENQEAFKKVAREIDPDHTASEVAAALSKDHPSADLLLPSFKDTFDGLMKFISKAHIATLPSQVQPLLEETPPFERAMTFASMDPPGPYEKIAKEAYFNVTPPEKTWNPGKVEEYLGGFNFSKITNTAIHEAYPGHYLQFLWISSVKSKVIKMLAGEQNLIFDGINSILVGSNVEGWAHYSEQMMLDEGFGNNDPKLRLGQLGNALLRNARFIVGIQMHIGKMSFDEAIQFFIKEGYQSKATAERETKRGTADPTYCVYTLGKIEILRLREDYKKKMGARFSLQEFHDRFLKLGPLPIRMIRTAMLGK